MKFKEFKSSIHLYLRMVENGIKPVYVFDGKPPTMKVIVKEVGGFWWTPVK